jgi:ApaG protein
MKQISKSNRPLEEHFPGIVKSPSDRSYSATTSDIKVTVWPEFVDNKSGSAGEIFIWAYHVKVENKSPNPVQLKSRSWRIIDEKGITQEVNGDGVVGEQPTIASGTSYQYTSGVHLRHPSGIMSGQYHMQSGDASFSIKVPTFSLDMPGAKQSVN